MLPARNPGAGGPQWAPGGPHGSGYEADGNVPPDVQTDGDGAEPRDCALLSADQRQSGHFCQGEPSCDI